MSARPEIDRADPLGVVHAGQRRNDDPRRESVVGRQVCVVDSKREKRIRVHAPGCPAGWRRLNAPRRSTDRTNADAGFGTPASRARRRSGTPVHVSVVDQPSTQAMGSRAVCCVIAVSAARSSTTFDGPPVRVSRHRSPVSSGVMPAANAVRLTWKSFGPSPRVRPRGSSSAAMRVKPPMVCPAVITAMNSAPPPTSASAPRRLIVAAAGFSATRPSGSYGSGTVLLRLVRNTSAHRHRPQAGPHPRNLDRDVDDEAGDEHPCAVIVGGVEAEPEDVVVLDVENTGDDLEEDSADEHQQRNTFQHLRDRPGRWPREQPRDHRPQLGQHDGDEDQSEPDVQTLVESVQPRRVGRPVERRQLQPADVAGNGLPELRPVRDVGQQAGDDDDRQRRQQDGTQYRRQPQSAQWAAPRTP